MSASKAKINICFYENHSCRLCFIASCSISPSIFSDQFVKCVVGCVSLRTCFLMIYLNFSTFLIWHSAALQFEYTCDAPKKKSESGLTTASLWKCWTNTLTLLTYCLLCSVMSAGIEIFSSVLFLRASWNQRAFHLIRWIYRFAINHK